MPQDLVVISIFLKQPSNIHLPSIVIYNNLFSNTYATIHIQQHSHYWILCEVRLRFPIDTHFVICTEWRNKLMLKFNYRFVLCDKMHVCLRRKGTEYTTQMIKILGVIQTNIYSLLFFPFEAVNANEGHHYNVSPLSDTLGEKILFTHSLT